LITDTSFIIDLIRNKQFAIDKVIELKKKNIPLYITAITVFELMQGNKDIANADKMKKLEELFDTLGIYSFDIQSAKISGKILRELIDEGMIIESEDAMIAGIAIKNSQSLLTRNVKHFQRIKGLTVETY